MNRAERRRWAKQSVPRRRDDGREASGASIREARRIAAGRINAVVTAKENGRKRQSAKEKGLEVVEGKDLLWTPEKGKRTDA